MKTQRGHYFHSVGRSISKTKSLGMYVGERGVQGAHPGSLSSHVVDSVFIQRALFEVDATAIKA